VSKVHDRLDIRGPNNEELFERDDSNLDRGSDPHTEELVQKILSQGFIGLLTGIIVVVKHPTKPGMWKLVTHGHRLSAIYIAILREPRNKHVLASLSIGLENVYESLGLQRSLLPGPHLI